MEIEQYVQDVMHLISAPDPERERIEADLRDHLSSAVQTGQAPEQVIERMGSPNEVAAAFMSQVQLKYAGFEARLGAFIIDMIVMIPAILILVGIATAASSAVPQHPQGVGYVYGALLGLVIFGAVLAIIGIALLYFPVQEARFGQTLGKRFAHLRVLKENGMPIGYKEAFIRRLGYYFEMFAIDALFIFFTEKRQRAFDIVARTVVVQEE